MIAVWCVYGVGARFGLSRPLRALLAGSFSASTLALVYSRAVNQHELILAVLSLLFLEASRMSVATSASRGTWLRMGALAGLALDRAAPAPAGRQRLDL